MMELPLVDHWPAPGLRGRRAFSFLMDLAVQRVRRGGALLRKGGHLVIGCPMRGIGLTVWSLEFEFVARAEDAANGWLRCGGAASACRMGLSGLSAVSPRKALSVNWRCRPLEAEQERAVEGAWGGDGGGEGWVGGMRG